MPRGRPKKAKKTKKKATKRGRPPGSKNKKKTSKKVAKKKGRRGRPPGSKNKKTKTTKKKTKKTKRSSSGKAMTKMEIAAHMAELHDMKKSEARDFIANFVALAATEVKKNGAFAIPGLGKFVKKRRKARMGRNPATGEKIKIKAKTVVKARVSKTFKDEVL
jgi:DNA-binding protein HU-beta